MNKIMNKNFLSIALAFMIYLASFLGLQAQGGNTGNSTITTSSGTTSSGNVGSGAFYDYGGKDGYTIDVNVWGFVNRPGKYRVPSSTTLVQIISYAGGPSDRARLEDIRIVHDVTIDSTIKEPVVIYNMEEYKRTGNPKLNPLLYYADTIIVQGDAINLLEKTLQIAGSVATVILSILAVVKVFFPSN